MGIALRTVSRLTQPIPSLFSKKDKKKQAVIYFSTSATSTILDGTRVVGAPRTGYGAVGKRGNRFSPTSAMEWWGSSGTA
jgi:hypothetical protein